MSFDPSFQIVQRLTVSAWRNIFSQNASLTVGLTFHISHWSSFRVHLHVAASSPKVLASLYVTTCQALDCQNRLTTPLFFILSVFLQLKAANGWVFSKPTRTILSPGRYFLHKNGFRSDIIFPFNRTIAQFVDLGSCWSWICGSTWKLATSSLG